MKSLEELRAEILKILHIALPEEIDGIVSLINQLLREDLLGLQEVADVLGVTLSAANMRAHRKKLPLPVTNVGNNRIWTRWELGDYLAKNQDDVPHDEPEEVSNG